MKSARLFAIIFILSIGALGALNTSVTVYTIGDSTMAPYDTSNNNPQRGWAQMLPQFFSQDVAVVNAARGGRSSKSFYNEGLWSAVINQVNPGDYVFIQFAHNDEKTDTAYHTDPWTSYIDYLTRYVTETRARGGIPVFFTPIVRRYFDGTGHITATGLHNVGPGDSLGNYPMAMRWLASSLSVPIIDLTNKTETLVESYGAGPSAQLYIPTDQTHPDILGATLIAQLAAQGIREQNILPLATYVDTSSSIVVSPKSISFGDRYLNTTSGSNTFSVSGFNLTPASGSVTITAPSGFQVSLDGSAFMSSVSLSYTNGNCATSTVWVNFTPTAVTYYSGTMTITTGGSTVNNPALDGTGIRIPTGLVADSVIWTLLSSQIPTASSGISASNQYVGNLAGITYNSSYSAFGSGWQRTGTTGFLPTTFSDSAYIDYRVTPQPGTYFLVDTVFINALGGGSGNGKLAAYYSLDNFATAKIPLGTAYIGTTPVSTSAATSAAPISLLNSGSASNTGGQNITFAPNITVKGGQTLVVRFNPWCTTASKYLASKNIKIAGDTKTASSPTPPVTTPVSAILATTAESGGTGIVSDSNALITSKGVCWNLSGAPTTGDPKTIDGNGTGDFSSAITGLIPGLTYYVRAYATNSAGTSYGNELSFATSSSATPPLVTTLPVSTITVTTATGGGNITTDGGAPLTASGLCWNTTGAPTIVDATTNVGVNTGIFSSTMTGLTSSTVYHVRAYATNPAGTAYGAEVTFTTTGVFYNTPAANVADPASWGTNPDGSGNHPDFSKDNQVYNVTNPGAVFGANWTISSKSKVVVGNGTDTTSFTIPEAWGLSGTIDVSASGVLIIRNTTNLIPGTLNTASSVEYDGGGSLAILPGTYGTLRSTNDSVGTRSFPSGTVNIAGSFDPGRAVYSVPVSGTVAFTGSTPQSIPSLTFFNLKVSNAAGCTIPGSAVITTSGNIQVTSGSLAVTGLLENKSANTPLLTGTLVIRNGGVYKVNGGAFPAATYETGCTIIVVSGSPALPVSMGGNLVWNSTGSTTFSPTNDIGGDFTMTAGTFTMGTGGVARTLIIHGNMLFSGGSYTAAGGTAAATIQTLTVAGNLTVSGGTLYASNNGLSGAVGTINVGGNLLHTGGTLGNGPNVTSILTGKIVFNGTSPQTIQTTGFSNNLNTVINSTGGVIAGSDLGIDAGLTLTNGIIILGSSNLTLGPAATIDGSFSAGAMVVPNGTGRFRKQFSSAGSFLFPVGDVAGTAEYAPVSITVSATSYDTALVDITTIRAKHPSNTGVGDYLNRYWSVSTTGFTGGTYSGTFTYPLTDVVGSESNLYGALYAGSAWTNTGAVSSATHSFSTPVLTTPGDFTAVDGSVVNATPILAVSPVGLAFGRVDRNTTAPVQHYSCIGHALAPAADTVLVSAPTGYQISTNDTTGFGQVIRLPYTGGELASTLIAVRFHPTAAQTYNGFISNSGGGASAQNVTLTGMGIIPNSELGVNSIVAKDGSGDFSTIQAAINAVPVSHPGISPFIIYIRPGFYHEKVTIPGTLSDLKIVGEDRDSTILDYNDYVGSSGTAGVPGTNAVQTLQINASSLTIENMTIQNLVTVERAVAINISNNADKVLFRNCNIDGHQDTYYLWNCYRVYHTHCRISGSVDFIFGNGTAVFDSCSIVVNRNSGVLTAASTTSNFLFGLTFRYCTITADSIGFDGATVAGFWLGRPWNANPRTVFYQCYEPAALKAGGWTLMNADPSASMNQNALFAEYLCSGPGFSPTTRDTLAGNPNYGRQLGIPEAANYTLANIFSAASKTDGPFPNGNWMPVAEGGSFTLTLQAVNGTVTKSPDLPAYAAGTVVHLTAVPNTGYSFAGWTGDLAGITNPDSVVMTANRSVTAEFAAIRDTIQTIAIGSGTILPPGPVVVGYDSSQAISFVPNAGYHVDSVFIDGVYQHDSTAGFTFHHVTVGHTVIVKFVINQYTITAVAGAHGAISPSGHVPEIYGADQAFFFTPDDGYHVDSLIVDGAQVPDSLTRYTFRAITGDHSIRVVFRVDLMTIAVSLRSGWNMVSLPLEVTDSSIAAIFGSAVSGAFSYEGTYVVCPALQKGKGYWLKYPSAQMVPVKGVKVTGLVVPVTQGWNLVGGMSLPVPVGMIGTADPGMTVSQFFTYNGRYIVTDTIWPGSACWVKAGTTGTLALLSGTRALAKTALTSVRIVPQAEQPPPAPDAKSIVAEIPGEYALGQAYPNPFNPEATIAYQLPEESFVRLNVYNILGQIVAVLVDGRQAAGYQAVTWNASIFGSGVYIYSIEAASVNEPGKVFTSVRKMTLVK
jgi:uncharacterized repeat protein (TIGR02543 family)